MSTVLTINVQNNLQTTQEFYFFQAPPIIGGGSQVFSNSLYSAQLGNYEATGGILTFQVETKSYAGIQQSHSTPTVGLASGYASAFREVELARADVSGNDCTTATVTPVVGLSPAVNGPGVQAGAFRITMPVFSSPPFYNIGSAVNVIDAIVLSNFIVANPATNTDIQPVQKYYVQTGSHSPGAVLNFTQASVNAAVCDFTTGYTTCNVTLNADGTWTVQQM